MIIIIIIIIIAIMIGLFGVDLMYICGIIRGAWVFSWWRANVSFTWLWGALIADSRQGVEVLDVNFRGPCSLGRQFSVSSLIRLSSTLFGS